MKLPINVAITFSISEILIHKSVKFGNRHYFVVLPEASFTLEFHCYSIQLSIEKLLLNNINFGNRFCMQFK